MSSLRMSTLKMSTTKYQLPKCSTPKILYFDKKAYTFDQLAAISLSTIWYHNLLDWSTNRKF